MRTATSDASTHRPRRWIPVAIVVALVAVVVGGAQVFARAVTAGTGGTLAVGAGVRLQPAPGWDVEAVTAAPATARLHRGGVVPRPVAIA